MPHEVGVNGPIGAPMDSSILTIGDIFRDAGYDTAYAGKWHLAALYHYGAGDVDQHGFRFLTFPKPENEGLGAVCDPPTADAAISFLREPHERPFLLTVSFHNPHDICHYLNRGQHPIGDLAGNP